MLEMYDFSQLSGAKIARCFYHIGSGRELHDGRRQSLGYLNMQLEAARSWIAGDHHEQANYEITTEMSAIGNIENVMFFTVVCLQLNG